MLNKGNRQVEMLRQVHFSNVITFQLPVVTVLSSVMGCPSS